MGSISLPFYFTVIQSSNSRYLYTMLRISFLFRHPFSIRFLTYTAIMKKTLFLFILSFVSVLSFAQSDNYQLTTNVAYYSSDAVKGNDYMSSRCVLDIYTPKDKSKKVPTVVWFHGGGLTAGEKIIPNDLKNKDICIVAVNYRLAPKAEVPQILEDAAAAVAWVFQNIDQCGGDSSAVFVSGHSAGGYLVSMIGLDKKWLAKHNVDADRIAGLIPLSGHAITHFLLREQKGMPGYQPVIDEFAPIYYVRKDAPPLLMITGDRELEFLGRYEENAYMMRLMKLAGHTDTRLYELDGYGHDMLHPAFPLLLREIDRISKAKSK